MKEYFDDAVNELKRVDHLIYVSLKYTRTVDVIKSVIERLLNAFDFGIMALIKYGQEKKLITSQPPLSPSLKVDLLKKTFSDNSQLIDYLNFYLMLRKISRADLTKREEYRRHVTMIATLETNEVIEIDIDKLREYFEKTKEFLKFIKGLIIEEND